MDLRWALAIGLEAAFWIMLAGFLVLRYRYGMERVTRLFVIGTLLDTAGFIALGIWDYAETGKISAYTVFIVTIILYSFTVGKEHLRRLDGWMERKLRPREAGGR